MSRPSGQMYVGEPDKGRAAMAEWLKAHPASQVTLSEVADHVEHIAKIAGVDHAGIGSDFDRVGLAFPDELHDVGDYPALLAELMHRGWSDADIARLAGGNIVRAMAAAEKVAASTSAALPETAREAQLDQQTHPRFDR